MLILAQSIACLSVDYAYTYDYTGCVLSADSTNNFCDQTFTYRADGSMASNDHVGTYIYDTAQAPDHTHNQIDDGSTVETLTYDGENRPLDVAAGGKTTAYVYRGDANRLKLIEDRGGQNETITAYFGAIEIRNFS